jgi:DNA-binding CsgD family transcriptional regulator
MPPVTLAGKLVGRDPEVALLRGLVREVSRGRGNCVLIEGEPGIGKSTLARVATTLAADVGCQAFWGAGDELGQALPLVAFLDALRIRESSSANPRRNTIVQLLRGEISAYPGTDVPALVAEQLLALIAEQCAVQPTVLVIDDLQWSDPSSVTLWGRLARSTVQMPLLLIGTMRPIPHREDLLALRRLVDEPARIELGALSGTAVQHLVATLAGGVPDDNLLALADGASGNPLYLTELVAALARSSSLTITDSGTAELASPTAPRSLSAVIADRLGFVSTSVREILQAAALLGVDFAVDDLATVLGRTVPDLVPAVNEARTAGVLTESDNGFGFRHPLIRAALYDEMPGPLRVAWHRDAGRALAEAGAPPERVARQMLQTTNGSAETAAPMDEWMLDWLTRSADNLVGQAPAVAGELLTWAVANSPAGSDRYTRLASRLADALYRTGDRSQAEQVVERALEYATDPDLIVDLHWTLAQCRMLAGSSAESLATLDRALAAPGLLARHKARLLVLAARTHGYLGEPERANEVASAALSAASEAGDNWAMGWALLVLSNIAVEQGRMADALLLIDRALALTQADSALSDLHLLLQINKAVTLGNIDEYEDAFTVARQALLLVDRGGTAFRLTQVHGALSYLLFESGRWDSALTEVQAVPEGLKEPTGACAEHGIAAVIGFHRGDTTNARRHLTAARLHAERIGNRLIPTLILAESLEREHEGAFTEAFATLTDAFPSDPEDLEEIDDLCPDGVRLAMIVGDESTAQALTSHATELAAGSEIRHRLGNALYCRGLLEHDAALLLQAADKYADATRPLLRAQALEAAAHELLRVDERTQARNAFNDAVDVYTSLGAAADISRLQAVFRQQGIRRGPRSQHRKAQSGWESLTPTEIKVASFVEEGLSNPEIASKLLLSRRTVGTHVSHILKKLNVATRTDIARESALRRGR